MPVVLQAPVTTNPYTKTFFLSIQVVETPDPQTQGILTLTATWLLNHFTRETTEADPPGQYAESGGRGTVTWNYNSGGGYNDVTYTLPKLRGHCTLPSSNQLVVDFALDTNPAQTKRYVHSCNAPSVVSPFPEP